MQPVSGPVLGLLAVALSAQALPRLVEEDGRRTLLVERWAAERSNGCAT